MTIKSEAFVEVVDLVEPLANTPNERQALLDMVFIGNSRRPDIDVTGAPRFATRRMVFALYEFGSLDDGTPALCSLLSNIRSQVGTEKNARIDVLRTLLFSDKRTTAEYTVVSDSGKYIFLSYTHADSAFVERLRADLQASGINLWIDHLGLMVGTPDWEEALRVALERADGMLLIASPESRRSDFVRDELAIALRYNKPIYPVWIAGDHWHDAVPLGRGAMQYADLRSDNYQAGFKDLLDALQRQAPETLDGNSETAIPASTQPTPKLISVSAKGRNLPFPFLGALAAVIVVVVLVMVMSIATQGSPAITPTAEPTRPSPTPAPTEPPLPTPTFAMMIGNVNRGVPLDLPSGWAKHDTNEISIAAPNTWIEAPAEVVNPLAEGMFSALPPEQLDRGMAYFRDYQRIYIADFIRWYGLVITLEDTEIPVSPQIETFMRVRVNDVLSAFESEIDTDTTVELPIGIAHRYESTSTNSPARFIIYLILDGTRWYGLAFFFRSEDERQTAAPIVDEIAQTFRIDTVAEATTAP